MFVFPKVQFNEHFLNAGPVDSEGNGNPSGFIKEENFIKYAKHFVNQVKSSKEKSILVVQKQWCSSFIILPAFSLQTTTT